MFTWQSLTDASNRAQPGYTISKQVSIKDQAHYIIRSALGPHHHVGLIPPATWSGSQGIKFLLPVVLVIGLILFPHEVNHSQQTACHSHPGRPAPTTVPMQPTDTQPVPSAPAVMPKALPLGWAIYRNEVEGFEISYPASYLALGDAENLYGWANGLLLLYNSGQSYDIAGKLSTAYGMDGCLWCGRLGAAKANCKISCVDITHFEAISGSS